jgi:DNA-binding LytR/AlgR family response regulator
MNDFSESGSPGINLAEHARENGQFKVRSPQSIYEALRTLVHDAVRERGAKVAEFRPRLQALPANFVKIAIKTKRKIIFIDPADIVAVEAEGNHVLLRRRSDSYLLRQSITKMEEKLKPYGFLRIHRSVLVNASWVEEIRPSISGEYLLRLSGDKQYTVSRTYRKNLKRLAQSWIGTDLFSD